MDIVQFQQKYETYVEEALRAAHGRHVDQVSIDRAARKRALMEVSEHLDPVCHAQLEQWLASF